MEAERRDEERKERLMWAKERLKEAETGGLSAGRAGTEGKDVGQSKGKGEKQGGIRMKWTSWEFRRRKGEIEMSLGAMSPILFK